VRKGDKRLPSSAAIGLSILDGTPTLRRESLTGRFPWRAYLRGVPVLAILDLPPPATDRGMGRGLGATANGLCRPPQMRRSIVAPLALQPFPSAVPAEAAGSPLSYWRGSHSITDKNLRTIFARFVAIKICIHFQSTFRNQQGQFVNTALYQGLRAEHFLCSVRLCLLNNGPLPARVSTVITE